MEKEIRNIVFYKFDSEDGRKWQVCFFYKDGSVYNTDYETGRDLTIEFMDNNGIEELEEIIDKKYVYRVNGKEFSKMFQEFRTNDDPYNKNVETKALVKAEEEKTEEPEEKKTIFATIFSAIASTKLVAWLAEKVTNIKEFFAKRKETNSKAQEARDKILSKLKKENPEEENVEETIEKKKKENFFKRTFNKTWKKVAALATALAMLIIPISSCAKENDKQNDPAPTKIEEVKARDFDAIINSSKSVVQKQFMNSVSSTLDSYNEDFARSYLEAGSDVKAALSWDEVVSLGLVYNDFSKEQLISIFNGAELDQQKLQDAYKTATLQLFGAHVIETREYPVQMDGLIQSEQGKAFYEKYHEMFLACKEATGQDQINKVNAFYQELYKDFPINFEQREVGIAHSDPRDTISAYKFSIIPMVSASEILFQNLDIDNTLADKAIDYLDDLGVCNRANDIIEKATIVNLGANSNSEYANYEELKQAKIEELEAQAAYVRDDAHRDISQYNSFKEKVNVAFDYEEGKFNGTIVYSDNTSYSYQDTKVTRTSDREKAIDAVGIEKVKKAESAADASVKKENETARKEAQAAAEKEREHQQAQADSKKQEYEDKIRQDEKDLQDKIDEANKNQNSGGKVNESDFGDHDVDFDNDHSDKDGNLDDSVKDITTDPSGDKTDEPLPDPNSDYESSNTSVGTNETSQNIYEYEEPYTQMSKEEIAEAIVEQMATPSEDTSAKVYTYHV
jgi:hypothetical protein